jgi:type I restriction enzyme M protein
MAKKAVKKNDTTGNIGFEEKLWAAADKMRGHMDSGEYKHVALGLIFLKYISDSFMEKRDKIEKEASDPKSEWFVKEPRARYGVMEDRDQYLADNVFYVPEKARWSFLQAKAKQPNIGQLIDDAMVEIEKQNKSLKGVLPKSYARPDLDKQRLGELIDLIGTITLGDEASRSKDILGRVYEYFLSRFASAEGKGGGEFYTPSSIVRLLVEMIEPFKGRIYDPCCGSGGMFVQSERFVQAHGGRLNDLSVFGEESNPTTWRLCKMNLAIRGIDGNIGPQHGDSFHNDIHKDLKADYILANPPFNISDWGGERIQDDVRWKYGMPPAGNANFAWVQHMVHHLAPNGIAGFVLANGSMSSNSSGEGEIRKNIIEANLVDCMISMPGQLFYTTPIPVCLWFLGRNRENGKCSGGKSLRDRRGETLFIDARKLGTLVDRVHRELTEDEILKIGATYHAWRGEKDAGKYSDVPGFCKSVKLDEIKEHGYVLTPGRFVGAEEVEDDGEPFEDKMKRLTGKLKEQFEESHRLEKQIEKNLKGIGFEL